MDSVNESIKTALAYQIYAAFYEYCSSRHFNDDISARENKNELDFLYLTYKLFTVRCASDSVEIKTRIQCTHFNNSNFIQEKALTNGWRWLTYTELASNEDIYEAMFKTLIDGIKASRKDFDVACCHLYQQCSTARKCVLDTYSEQLRNIKRCCSYRLNLLQGNIFY